MGLSCDRFTVIVPTFDLSHKAFSTPERKTQKVFHGWKAWLKMTGKILNVYNLYAGIEIVMLYSA